MSPQATQSAFWCLLGGTFLILGNQSGECFCIAWVVKEGSHAFDSRSIVFPLLLASELHGDRAFQNLLAGKIEDGLLWPGCGFEIDKSVANGVFRSRDDENGDRLTVKEKE